MDNWKEKTEEEKVAHLWGTFEEMSKDKEQMFIDRSGYLQPDPYNQTQSLFEDRGFHGQQYMAQFHQQLLEFEELAKDFAREKIETKKQRMYKGTVKKWQILDD